MALLVAPILFIAAVVYVTYPLMVDHKEAAARHAETSEREKLLEVKEDVVSNLKDIEMDYRMGKLSQQDYLNLKADFERQAVEVFQKLEKLEESRKTRKKKS